MQAIQHLKVVSSTSPRRKRNSEYRSREHLTERDVERLIEAAKDNRWGHRDSTMALLAFRHGLRASELVDLRWEQVDLENGILHVRKSQSGHSGNASFDRSRAAGAPSPATRGQRLSLCVCERARRTILQPSTPSGDGGSGRVRPPASP